MHDRLVARAPLFSGLAPDALEDVARHARMRHFAARETLCRQGESGNTLFVIVEGLADVIVEDTEGGRPATVARLRRGDVVGEMSLLTGEPRSATVVARLPGVAMEIDSRAFAGALSRHPVILTNLASLLSRRLARTNLQSTWQDRRGEAVALVLGPSAEPLLDGIVSAAEHAGLRPVAAVPRPQSGAVRESAEFGAQGEIDRAAMLGLVDDLLETKGLVIVPARIGDPEVEMLAAQMDRVVVAGEADEIERFAAGLNGSREQPHPGAVGRPETQAIVLAGNHGSPSGTIGDIPVVHTLRAPFQRNLGWIGRHLTRTKLGLSLGAGGARGYAHVATVRVLEESGYCVDYAGGSSIGAMVGSWLALGMDAREIEDTMRSAFSPDNVAAMFKLSMAGTSTGLDVMKRVCEESTGGRSFNDLDIPLVVMTADLNSRRPAPIHHGRLADALIAGTALAGMFPPVARDDMRLVDGLALVPVPAQAVRDLGADIVLSVNLMSRTMLDAWPGSPVEPPPAKSGSRMLDTLLEVMDLAQLDSSVRHAALADVVVTPVFGPSSWRDFHLAQYFFAAGRAATEEQLPMLRSLTRPAPTTAPCGRREAANEVVSML